MIDKGINKLKPPTPGSLAVVWAIPWFNDVP